MSAPFRPSDDPDLYDLHRARDTVHARLGYLVSIVEQFKAGEVEETAKTLRLSVALACNALGDLLRDLTAALDGGNSIGPGTFEGFLAAAQGALSGDTQAAGHQGLHRACLKAADQLGVYTDGDDGIGAIITDIRAAAGAAEGRV